jgi:hypothetical protein
MRIAEDVGSDLLASVHYNLNTHVTPQFPHLRIGLRLYDPKIIFVWDICWSPVSSASRLSDVLPSCAAGRSPQFLGALGGDVPATLISRLESGINPELPPMVFIRRDAYSSTSCAL